MNERIRLFAEQAGAVTFGGKICLFGDQDIEKFAKLIAKQCMDLVKDCYAEPGLSLYQSVCASTIIEEHFGVEE
jgi:hypothetical protein